MCDEINKNNILRIRLMESVVQDYLDEKIDIGKLANDFEFLIYSLQKAPQKIVEEFISVWSVFEVNYAWMLCKNRTNLTEQEKIDVNEALQEMKILIKQYKVRQISLIELKIRKDSGNIVSFEKLINYLEALIDIVIKSSEKWREKIFDLINELELYYADVLCDQRGDFSFEEKGEIAKIIEHIFNIIKIQYL